MEVPEGAVSLHEVKGFLLTTPRPSHDVVRLTHVVAVRLGTSVVTPAGRRVSEEVVHV